MLRLFNKSGYFVPAVKQSLITWGSVLQIKLMRNREQVIITLGIVSAIASLIIGMARTATVSELPAQQLDYERLSKMLAAGAFQKADRQTYRMMLLRLQKYPDRLSKSIYLTEEDIARFPCKDLLKLDQLWHQYSRGKFSFRTQNKIWQNLQHRQRSQGLNSSELFDNFAQKVHWKAPQRWKSYKELTFDLDANPGHLPAMASGGSITTKIQVQDKTQKTDVPLWEFNVNCTRVNQDGQLIQCTPNLSPAIFSRLKRCQFRNFSRFE